MPLHFRKTASLLTLALSLFFTASAAAEKPLRIYILAGQSNMVGTGAIATFEAIAEDPQTASLYKKMIDADGQPRTCDRVWISSLNGKYRTLGGEGFGKLTAGYGVRREDPAKAGDCIGPEYTFGLTMAEQYDGPILLIKTAWGGKSLYLDYRPPSAGPYLMPEAKSAKIKSKGGQEKLAQILAENEEYCGKYYGLMMAHIKKVLTDIERVYPEYDEAAGYELGGFVWFQGWNDYAAPADYPFENGNQQFALYSDLLAKFIRDVRKDLATPELPFVIGVSGVNGNHEPGTFTGGETKKTQMERFRKAMAAPASLPEFKGNVFAVSTVPFWDDKLAELGFRQNKIKQMRRLIDTKSPNGPNADGKMTQAERKKFLDDYNAEVFTPEEIEFKKRAIGGGGFVHYYGSAKFHAQAGQAFAQALLQAN